MYGAKVWPHLAHVAERFNDLDLGSIARASRFQRRRARYRPAAARQFSPSATARRRVSVRPHFRVRDSINGVLEVLDQSEGSDVFYAWDIFFTTYLVILSGHVRHIP